MNDMMSGKLTTHVLDISGGIPAAGMRISVYRDGKLVQSAITNQSGRLDSPLIAGDQLIKGSYRLEFAVGDYFAARGDESARRFLTVVPIVFEVDDPRSDYHVPLLVSPWSYTTYRGS
jgi:5-hydroxyisourate hydrolase